MNISSQLESIMSDNITFGHKEEPVFTMMTDEEWTSLKDILEKYYEMFTPDEINILTDILQRHGEEDDS